MSRLLVALVCLALASVASAQTPVATENVGRPAGKPLLGPSAFNPWLGAQVGYKIGGTKEPADSLIVSAHIMYDTEVGSSKFFLPVVGNFADMSIDPSAGATDADQDEEKIEQLVMSSSGLRVGLYPYYKAITKKTFTLVIHGEAAWKLNAVNDTGADSVTYINEFRLSGGAEMGIGKNEDGKFPVTISIAPVLTKLRAEDVANLKGLTTTKIKTLEFTGVVPIAPRMGLLVEYVVGEKDSSAFRAGIVIATGVSK